MTIFSRYIGEWEDSESTMWPLNAIRSSMCLNCTIWSSQSDGFRHQTFRGPVRSYSERWVKGQWHCNWIYRGKNVFLSCTLKTKSVREMAMCVAMLQILGYFNMLTNDTSGQSPVTCSNYWFGSLYWSIASGTVFAGAQCSQIGDRFRAEFGTPSNLRKKGIAKFRRQMPIESNGFARLPTQTEQLLLESLCRGFRNKISYITSKGEEYSNIYRDTRKQNCLPNLSAQATATITSWVSCYMPGFSNPNRTRHSQKKPGPWNWPHQLRAPSSKIIVDENDLPYAKRKRWLAGEGEFLYLKIGGEAIWDTSGQDSLLALTANEIVAIVTLQFDGTAGSCYGF